MDFAARVAVGVRIEASVLDRELPLMGGPLRVVQPREVPVDQMGSACHEGEVVDHGQRVGDEVGVGAGADVEGARTEIR